MSEATFLTRVVLENYKSIAAGDVRLGPLTFLVGPNGAGKSNFLDALRFVGDGLVRSLDDAVRRRGGLQQLLHYPARPSAGVGIRLEFTLPSQLLGVFAFRLGRIPENPGTWGWQVLEEECRVGASVADPDAAFYKVRDGQVVSSLGIMPAAARDRLYLVRAAGVDPFREVHDALGDMHVYHPQPQSIPDIDVYDPQQRLRGDGSNVASVLAALQSTDDDAKERMEDFLRVMLPGLIGVRAEPVFIEGGARPVDDNKIALVFQQRVGQAAALFGPGQMSEGTLRVLVMLAALYQVDPVHRRRPTLTAVEDVEAAVHPAELPVIFDALDEASLTTQVLATTHSPDLLDHKELRSDSIRVVSAEQGVTRIGPLDEASREILRRQLSTPGGLLRMGQIAPMGSGSVPPLPANEEAMHR